MEEDRSESLMDPDLDPRRGKCEHKRGMSDNGNGDPIAVIAWFYLQLATQRHALIRISSRHSSHY